MVNEASGYDYGTLMADVIRRVSESFHILFSVYWFGYWSHLRMVGLNFKAIPGNGTGYQQDFKMSLLVDITCRRMVNLCQHTLSRSASSQHSPNRQPGSPNDRHSAVPR